MVREAVRQGSEREGGGKLIWLQHGMAGPCLLRPCVWRAVVQSPDGHPWILQTPEQGKLLKEVWQFFQSHLRGGVQQQVCL